MPNTTPGGSFSARHRLDGQRVVVIGASAGIGRATAELAARSDAAVVLTARNEGRLAEVAELLGAESYAAFDALDPAKLSEFFTSVGVIDHVFVAAGGPYYAALPQLESSRVATAFSEHVLLMVEIARLASPRIRPGGTILFMAGSSARHAGVGHISPAAVSAAMSAAVASLAVEIAPARINVIAAGFVDTSLSAELLGDELDARREQLRRTLPIRRVVTPEDVGSLAIHLMENTAITGATFDIDGGQQLVE